MSAFFSKIQSNALKCMHLCAYLRSMQYEWNETKRQENLRKHGVDFADAVGALEDPASLTVEDSVAESELRFVTLGAGFTGRVLYVVWTERSRDVIRIISARKASPGEASHYHEEVP